MSPRKSNNGLYTPDNLPKIGDLILIRFRKDFAEYEMNTNYYFFVVNKEDKDERCFKTEEYGCSVVYCCNLNILDTWSDFYFIDQQNDITYQAEKL